MGGPEKHRSKKHWEILKKFIELETVPISGFALKKYRRNTYERYRRFLGAFTKRKLFKEPILIPHQNEEDKREVIYNLSWRNLSLDFTDYYIRKKLMRKEELLFIKTDKYGKYADVPEVSSAIDLDYLPKIMKRYFKEKIIEDTRIKTLETAYEMFFSHLIRTGFMRGKSWVGDWAPEFPSTGNKETDDLISSFAAIAFWASIEEKALKTFKDYKRKRL